MSASQADLTSPPEMDLFELPILREISHFAQQHPRAASVVLYFILMGLGALVAWELALWGRPGHGIALVVGLDWAIRGLCAWPRAKALTIAGIMVVFAAIWLASIRFAFVHEEGFSLTSKPIVYGLLSERGMSMVGRGDAIAGGCILGAVQRVVFIGCPWGTEIEPGEIRAVWQLP